VSAAISGGWPREIVRRWLLGEFEMIVSYDLLLELETVLPRDKFRKRLAVADVLSYVEFLRERATVVSSRRVERSPSDSPVPDDEYLVHLAEDSQADRIVSGDRDFRGLPQAETPAEFVVTLVQAQQERLTTQIPEYYRAYFSERRSQLERPDVYEEAVPGWMRGYKRIVSVGGRDGQVVVHFPRETEVSISREDGTQLLVLPSEPDAEDDTYELTQFPQESVSVLANFIGGGEDIEIGIEPDVPWGVKGFARPQQAIDANAGELAWTAPWTRMIAADLTSLHYFEDPERARAEAREDVDPYIHQG
jgi:putative PIN family toxin of toxin-antitoxin system